MDESSPRSREVANALLQIDRLTETQVRSILRHVAIDDAVLNEAQCSHVAGVINGTLSKEPREGVNASLTCGTSLDAASHWEKSFATQPGVSTDAVTTNWNESAADACHDLARVCHLAQEVCQRDHQGRTLHQTVSLVQARGSPSTSHRQAIRRHKAFYRQCCGARGFVDHQPRTAYSALPLVQCSPVFRTPASHRASEARLGSD